MNAFPRYSLPALLLVYCSFLGSPSGVLAESIYTDTKQYSRMYKKEIFKGKTLMNTFNFNAMPTTPYGPAYANIAIPEKRIPCAPPLGRPHSYALCYYSGPNYPTGIDPSNPSLPCTLSKDKVSAQCDCLLITTSGKVGEQPYYVGLDVISNLDIYKLNAETCKEDGSACASQGIVPPVCEALNVNLLVPGADVVSVYSEALQEKYYPDNDTNASTNCSDGLYAGCMTSPCMKTGKRDASGREIVQCTCPVYKGPYQIGQANQSCDANLLPGGPISSVSLQSSSPGQESDWSEKHSSRVRYVWSAKNNPAVQPQ